MPVRRNEGRSEPIIDPDLPIIDAHFHLIHRPVTYMAPDYLADVNAGHNILASVYVETRVFERQTGPEALRPVGEVEFANGIGAMTATGVYGPCHVAAGIVGHVDMRLGADVAACLDRCLDAAPERFRGVRHLLLEFDSSKEFPTVIGSRPPTGIMQSPGFDPALKELEKRGLPFDVSVFHYQLPEVASLADANPGMTFVLNHCGIAAGFKLDAAARAEVFRQWSANMRLVAERPNIICKVGGLGMPHWGFDFESHEGEVGYADLARVWRPYVETAIEAFGPDRCMMESNFPPDGRSAGFVPLWNALKHITRDAGDGEKTALYSGTAKRVYRLEVPKT